ncbi:MAG: nicotinate-nucleotide adenylyltransferase [Lachnospiraceae bacterium]|nr:nicotinate-nucleotide adenylyltransferase [Lachnospiraceae bacterium]
MSDMKRRKVGIMGGTFDPIHIGHLILGESAWEQFGLEKVLFMPSGNPPHKTDRHGATNEQRVEMVRRAIASNDHFELSLEEMHEQGYVYTKETLKRLHSEHPDTDYYFIMGADSVLSFHMWNGPQEICDQCILVAAVRDQMPAEELDAQILKLKEMYHADIRKLESPNLDISSHTIRERCMRGESIRYYVPDVVRLYIQDEEIYGNNHSC